jgi:hypothetical protein
MKPRKTQSGVIFVALCLSLSGCGSSKKGSVNAPIGSSLSAEQKSVVGDAMKLLRKVDAATEVGVSYAQYGPMLIDAQASVNEASTALPEGEVKNELKLAIEAYKDAYLAWQVTNKKGFITVGQSIPPAMAEGSHLVKKYSIPLTFPNDPEKISLVSKEDALNTIWKVARTHTEKASSLLR